MEHFDLSKFSNITLYAINRLNIVEKETRRANRQLFALSCKTHGRTVYKSNGKSFVSDPEHILLLPKGASYITSYEELGECFMIEFDAADDFVISDIQSYAVANTMEMHALFRRAERHWSMKKTAYYHRCISGCYEILSRLEEANPVAYRFSSKQGMISPSVEYLKTHYYDKGLNIDTLAEKSGISTVYFRKIFTEVYKMPPAKYLQDLRIDKAKELLISDYPSVGAVAESVGFGDIYHFCKMFKKITGCTPSEYAKSAIQLNL